MLIDIDHMSERAVERVLGMAEIRGYPVNSGHNGLRRLAPPGLGNENQRMDWHLVKIQRLGGMFGVGHGGGAPEFVRQFVAAAAPGLMANQQLAIGTDVNGFFPLPGPPGLSHTITYDNVFQPARMGDKTWNFNETGMAHYGLFPDYIRSWRRAGLTDARLDTFFSSAEWFARMWERASERAHS